MTTSKSVQVDEQARAAIKKIVCDRLEVEPAEMTDTSRFIEEHNADSLDAIDILAALEMEFGVEIDPVELTKMVNLEGVIAVVKDAAVVE